MEVLPAIRIPLSEPCSFDSLRRLNPEASNEQLAVAFGRLPGVLQEEAWEQLRLRAALTDWNEQASNQRGPGSKGGSPAP
jgi:hypothetical protein